MRLLLLLPLLLAALPGRPTQRHVFPAPGSYPVTLTVCNRTGCASTTKIVRVLNPRPTVPLVTLPAKLGSAQQAVSLSAEASGRPPLRWEWTLTRPGKTLRLKTNPAAWTFDALGVHQVKVAVRNPWGFASSQPFTVEVVPTTFEDVAPTHPDFEPIETLAALRISLICSSSPHVFCPERPLTRAETAVQLAAAVFGPIDRLPPAAGLFADVPVDHWAAPAIEHLTRNRVVSGCSTAPSLFCPESVTTRADAAVFVVRAAHGSSFVPIPPAGLFPDVPASSPAAPYIEQLAREGIAVGCSLLPPLYCPSSSLTRAELARFLVRALHLVPTPTAVVFEPKYCARPCAAAVNAPIVFRTVVRGGIPTLYEYDWNGDGLFEETSTFPVLSHNYPRPGLYLPVLRIRRDAHTAQIGAPSLEIAPIRFSTVPSRPTGLSAAFQGIVSPSAEDPPGTFRRASFLLQASSLRATTYNVYLTVNGSPFQLVDALSASDLASSPVKLPVFSTADNATLQLRPVNASGVGPSSLNLRLSLHPR